MTTTLLSLRGKLKTAIGDKNQVYADDYTDAINNAIREIYPALFRSLDNHTLVTGNALPNAHFDRWDTTTEPYLYTKTNATCTEVTTAGLIRGGVSSACVTASAADGYMYITSNDWPSLLDLMDKTVSFKCWAYPSTADDAFLTIYTIQADGTTQTLNSTTTCPATKWTLLELEDQELNDDLVEIQFRFRVHTNGETVHFDAARVVGYDLYEYLLPKDFIDGVVRQVWVQDTGYSDDICDDLEPRSWDRIYGYRIIDDGTYKYIRLPYLYSDSRQIRLLGTCPLEILSADTDTISLDGEKVNLLIAYAAYLLYEMQKGVAASEDVSRYAERAGYWWGKYKGQLAHLRMASPSHSIKLGVY